MSDKEIRLYNKQEVRSALLDIVESSIIIGKPSAKVETMLIWLLEWQNQSVNNVKSHIRKYVLDDVPHQYQKRLLNATEKENLVL